MLLDILNRGALRRELEEMAGYEAADTGTKLF